jgi:hypothetical protein
MVRLLCTPLLLLLSIMAFGQQQTGETPTEPTPVLRHVVSFKFKADAPSAKIDEIVAAFEALPSKIAEIKGFEWGINNSPEGHDKGFTHVFFLTFHSEAGREIYLPHPDHQAFGALLIPYLDDVMVVDYWTK